MKSRFFNDEELSVSKVRKNILIDNLVRVLDPNADNVKELDALTYSNSDELTDILNTSCVHVSMKADDGKIYDVYHFGELYSSTNKTDKGDSFASDESLQGYTIILKSGQRSKTNINSNLRIVSGGVDVKGKSGSGIFALRSFQVRDSWNGLMPTHTTAALKKTEIYRTSCLTAGRSAC